MSTSSKGSLWEKIGQKTMEYLWGMRVHRTERKMVRTAWGWSSGTNDMWGCIDLAGVSKTSKAMYIQVTCAQSGVGSKAAEMRLVPWNPKHMRVEIWRGVGGKGGQKWDKRFREQVMLEKWYFQRYRLENDFKMVKGDVVVIPPEVLDAVLSRKKPKCACGKSLKKALEKKIGQCEVCIKSKDPGSASQVHSPAPAQEPIP